MGQTNYKQEATFKTPPSGSLGFGFDTSGNPVRINTDGTTTIIPLDTNVAIQNVIANLGVGLEANLPTVGLNVGDVYVTNDTYKVFTRVDAISWQSVDLIRLQFVTDDSQSIKVLWQFNGTVLNFLAPIAGSSFEDLLFNIYNTLAGFSFRFSAANLTGNRIVTLPDKDVVIGEDVHEPTIEPQVVSGTPNTVTLNMNNAKIARFEPQLNGTTYSINVNFRLILSGATNGREISVFTQLSGTRIIDLSQFGSNCKVSVPSTIGSWGSPNLTLTAGTDDPILIVGIYNKSNGWWDLSVNEVSL